MVVMIPDGAAVAGARRYRRASDDEASKAQEAVFLTSITHPSPSAWLSKLKFRQPVRTYSNGSAAGHVRKREWLTGGGT